MALRHRRTAEVKQGRIFMLAAMGFMSPEADGEQPGFLAPHADRKIAGRPEGAPSALAAIRRLESQLRAPAFAAAWASGRSQLLRLGARGAKPG